MSIHSKRFRLPLSLVACVVGAFGLFFFWERHGPHVWGAIPYLFLLLCPLLHLLMHRGHGPHPSERESHDGHSRHGSA